MKKTNFFVVKIISLIGGTSVLLAALVSFCLHRQNIFLATFVVISIPCSLLAFGANLMAFFASKTHRRTYLILTILFAIIIYAILFGWPGRRSVLAELRQYRRSAWFFEVGKKDFENYITQNTNNLGKTFEGCTFDNPDMRVMGKRNEDGSVDLEFGWIGDVPRMAYLYHTGVPSGDFPRHYGSVIKLTNYWYDVSF